MTDEQPPEVAGDPGSSEDEWWSSTQALLFSEEDRRAIREGGEAAFPSGIGEGTGHPDEQTTEWFTFDEGLDTGSLQALPRRVHHVTTVLVAHDGAAWLPAVVTGIANQTRPADVAIGVDTGSTDTSLSIMREAFGDQRAVEARRGSGFGEGVRAALAYLDREAAVTFGEGSGAPEGVQWVWLLHDDSAPTATCLQALLDTADDNPGAAILGTKILGWHDARLLLEAGVSVTGSGRRFTGLEIGEHDQGQHDGVREVMAVSSAGMLVRRDLWDLLGGFDPRLPLFRDDLDFCWRAHRAGQQVLIATRAVVHHREASTHGRRATGVKHPERTDREAAVHVLLAQAPPFAAPFVALRLLLGSILRSLAFLLGKDVAGARDEVAAVLSVAVHPVRLGRSRALVRRTSTEPSSAVRHLRPKMSWQLRQAIEAFIGIATTSSAAPASSVTAMEAGPGDDDSAYLEATGANVIKRLLIRPSVFIFVGLSILTIAASWGLWWGSGVLQGGALLPSPTGATDLWERYAQAWHDVGPGSNVPSAPFLMLVYAVAVALLGKGAFAVQVIMLMGIPVAGWAAYFALRGVVSSSWIRAWAGVAYALLPAVTGAVAAGRLGTMMVAILFPFAARSFVRIARSQGTFRRAAGTALLLTALTAAAPAMWIIALIAAAAVVINAWTSQGRSAIAVTRRMALAAFAPLLLLMPWTVYLFTHPALFLLEPGVASPTLNDPNIAPLDILLLHPGGPGMTPIWISVAIVLAGLLALFRRDNFASILTCWSVATVALAIGMVQVVLLITPPGATTALRSWPGPATLTLGAVLILAAALGADGLPARLSRENFNLMQPVAALVAVAAVVAPIATAVFWFPVATAKLVRAPASSVPAFVEADALSPQAPRTLVLRQDSEGRVLYSLINGAGPLLGDADVSPDASVWEAIDPLVAALASGRGGDEVQGLAGYSIRYVLLAAGTSADLIPVLDGAPGLRRLSSSGGEVLWSISGVTTRARVISEEGATGVDLAYRGIDDPSSPLPLNPYLAATMPVPGKALSIGALVDDHWIALATDPQTGESITLARVMSTGATGWSQAFALPSGLPNVQVSYDPEVRSRWLWLQGMILLVLVVLALPSRRSRIDPDADEAALATGASGVAR